MAPWLLILLATASSIQAQAKLKTSQLGKSCKGTQPGEVACGAPPLTVIKQFKTSSLVCENGKIKIMSKVLVEKTLSSAGPKNEGDCEWYGEFFCEGQVVEDLYRWWYYKKCTGGVMRVIPRPWQDVISDPRYVPASRSLSVTIPVTEPQEEITTMQPEPETEPPPPAKKNGRKEWLLQPKKKGRTGRRGREQEGERRVWRQQVWRGREQEGGKRDRENVEESRDRENEAGSRDMEQEEELGDMREQDSGSSEVQEGESSMEQEPEVRTMTEEGVMMNREQETGILEHEEGWRSRKKEVTLNTIKDTSNNTQQPLSSLSKGRKSWRHQAGGRKTGRLGNGGNKGGKHGAEGRKEWRLEAGLQPASSLTEGRKAWRQRTGRQQSD